MPISGICGVNDPIAVYPFNARYELEDASQCQNPDAIARNFEIIHEESNPHGAAILPQDSLHPIRIIDNDGIWRATSASILLWFKPRQLKHQPLLAVKSGTKYSLKLFLKSNYLCLKMTLRCNNEMIHEYEGKFSELDQTTDRWHFVGVTYSQFTGVLSLSVQDMLQYSAFVGYNQLSSLSTIRLGNIRGIRGSRFHGEINCFMLYRRALSFNEIARARNSCMSLSDDPGQLNDFYKLSFTDNSTS